MLDNEKSLILAITLFKMEKSSLHLFPSQRSYENPDEILLTFSDMYM
jgi:hypothetical protein